MVNSVDERKLVPELVGGEIQRIELGVLFINVLKVIVENNLLGIRKRVNTGLEQALVVVARRSRDLKKKMCESYVIDTFQVRKTSLHAQLPCVSVLDKRHFLIARKVVFF